MSNPLKEKLKFADKLHWKTYYDDKEDLDDFKGIKQRPRHKYCQICHTEFQEQYHTHIDSQQHLQKQADSPGTDFLAEIIEKVKKSSNRNKIIKKKPKRRYSKRIKENNCQRSA